MKRHVDDDPSIHQLARAALDEDALIELLETVSDEHCEADAAEALREVAAEDIVRYVLGSANRARRRARILTAEDIAEIADGGGGCCCCCGDSSDRSGAGVYTTVARYTKIDN